MAHPLTTTTGLTEKQAAFVHAVFSTATAGDAARAAGYAEESAAAAGARLMRHPAVQAAIQAEVAARIRTEGAPVAYRVLLSIVRDEQASPRVRVDAARTILDRAGHVAPSPAKLGGGGLDKPDNEKTAKELRDEIQALERALSDRAKLVDSPTGERDALQDIDMLS